MSVCCHGMYHSVVLHGGEWGEDSREEGGEMAKLPNKARMWKRRWLSLSRRGDERLNPSPLCFLMLFFFFPPAASFPPPPPCLSVAYTGDPLGSSSQPVSWSPPPEQHMIFHDYCYCLCPSSRCLRARWAVDAWQEQRRKLYKDKQELVTQGFTSNAGLFPEVHKLILFRIHYNTS